jgi:tetratricopeptide (TPR) repeat protein
LAAGYALAEALGHLERALEIWPQVPDAAERTGIDVVEALRRAGQSAYAAGALDRSLAMFDETLGELEPDADPERRALLMEARAATVLDSGREAEARLELERAAALLPDDRPSDARALVLTALASHRCVVGDFAGALAAAEQAVAAATGVGAPGREGTARMMLGMALVYLEGERGLPDLEAALRLAEEAEDHAIALRGPSRTRCSISAGRANPWRSRNGGWSWRLASCSRARSTKGGSGPWHRLLFVKDPVVTRGVELPPLVVAAR